MNTTSPPIATTAPLPVMEIFYSIQGEGYHTGTPASFVRLGGCNVGCHWCDVKASWHADHHPTLSITQIQQAIYLHQTKNVIITGGEPLMYDMEPLTTVLKAQGYQLHLETSGAYPMSGQWDWVCFSPKKFKPPHPSVYAASHELKAILFHPSDFAFAEQHRALLPPGCKLYLQPEWSKAEQMTPLMVNYAKQHPHWHLSLQTHKYLNIP